MPRVDIGPRMLGVYRPVRQAPATIMFDIPISTIEAFISVGFGVWWQDDSVLWPTEHIMEASDEVVGFEVP